MLMFRGFSVVSRLNTIKIDVRKKRRKMFGSWKNLFLHIPDLDHVTMGWSLEEAEGGKGADVVEGRGLVDEVEARNKSWEVVLKTKREGDEGKDCVGEMGDPESDDLETRREGDEGAVGEERELARAV